MRTAALTACLAAPTAGQLISSYLSGSFYSDAAPQWVVGTTGGASNLAVAFSQVYPNTTLLTQVRHLDVDRNGVFSVARDGHGHPGGGKFLPFALASRSLVGFAPPSSSYQPPSHPGVRDVSALEGPSSKVATEASPRIRVGYYRRRSDSATFPFPGGDAAPEADAEFTGFAFGQRVQSTGTTPEYLYDLSGDAWLAMNGGTIEKFASFPGSTAQLSTAGEWITSCAVPISTNSTGNATYTTTNAPSSRTPFYGTGHQRLTDLTSSAARCNSSDSLASGSLRLRYMLTTQKKAIFSPRAKGYYWLRVVFAVDLSHGYSTVSSTSKAGVTASGWPGDTGSVVTADTEVSAMSFCSADGDCVNLQLPSQYNIGSFTAGDTESGEPRVWAEGSGTTGNVYVDVPWSDGVGAYHVLSVTVSHSAAGMLAPALGSLLLLFVGSLV